MRRMMMAGAKMLARRHPQSEIDRLWKEADDAAAVFAELLGASQSGTPLLTASPEYVDWKQKAEAFRVAAEKLAVEKGYVPEGYFS